MDASAYEPARPSRLRLLLDHFSRIEDKRNPEDVAHKLNEIVFLCVCATIAECDSFDAIADWGKVHLGLFWRFLPFEWGVPSGRWLNIMMNRIDPDLFATCCIDWVRACWPEPPDMIDVTFQEDLSRVRKGHGAQNMALVRKFAFNKLRTAPPFSDPPNLPLKPCRRPTKPPRPKSLKLKRKIASWNVNRLAEILSAPTR